ncbi:hypothetical protein GCM10009530_56890 [Microbispora corallina]
MEDIDNRRQKACGPPHRSDAAPKCTPEGQGRYALSPGQALSKGMAKASQSPAASHRVRAGT